VKYFAAAEVIERANDRKWLDRATRAVNDHWAKQNQKRRPKALSAAGS
jgi:hypothetical protein